MAKAAVKERDQTPDLLKDVTPKQPLKVGDLVTKETKTINGKVIKADKGPKKPKNALAVVKPRKPLVAKIKPTNFLAVIAKAAADPNCKPENMRALLDMQKEIAAEEARMAFTTDFIAMQAELPTINAKGRIEIIKKGSDGQRIKGRDPVEQSTPYATFNEINRVTRPILQRHHFALSFTTDAIPSGGVGLIVRGVLKHERGHQEVATLSLPLETSGSKNNVQGVGSSMSYGKRYAAVALLNLVSEAKEDKDDNGVAAGQTTFEVTPDAKPKSLAIEQSTALVALIKSSGVGLERFLEKYKLTAVIDLDPALYDDAVRACNGYKSEADARAQRGQ
jgi:ERF superfamily